MEDGVCCTPACSKAVKRRLKPREERGEKKRRGEWATREGSEERGVEGHDREGTRKVRREGGG